MNIRAVSGKLFNTGFFHIFGGSVVNKIIQFLSSALLVRVLSKQEYGIFTQAWNIYSIVILASGLGLETAVMQVCSEKYTNEEYTTSIFAYALRFGTIFNLILSLLMILIGKFIPFKIQKTGGLLCVLAFLPLFQYIFGIMSVNLRYSRKNQEYSALLVINTGLIGLFSVIASVLFREKGLVVSYYIAYIISIIAGTRAFKLKLSFRRTHIDQYEKKGLFSIALVSMCNNALSQVLYLLDVFVIGLVVASEETLAGYKVATMIPTALTFIPLSFMIYIYPYFAEHIHEGRWCLEKYKKILLGMGGLNLVISGMLYVGAPLIINIAFGTKYVDALPIFRLLVINYFISGTFRIISGNLLVSQRKLKFNLFVAIVSSLVNIFADYFFIKWWGAIGAAYATVLVVIVSSILSTTYLIYTFLKKKY